MEHIELCNCEHSLYHFADTRQSGNGPEYHDYLSVPAGAYEAYFVGPICDACTAHMAEYMR